MIKVEINTAKPYKVYIGHEILKNAGDFCREVASSCKAAIISDENVAGYYLEPLKKSFEDAGFDCHVFVFPPGEASKSLETLSSLLTFLAKNSFTGGDLIVGMGGGVVTDLTGFAASVYKRGIGLVQIPTSLIAQADASVGGKTGINIPESKNLIGSFYSPKLVICDTKTLKTLSHSEFLNGMAEVIKTGLMFDGELFKEVMSGGAPEALVSRCVYIKKTVVEEDEFDLGMRRMLNFGHTVGHAVERLSGYTVLHGCAVAAGMSVITRAAVKNGVCEPETWEDIKQALEKYKLSIDCPYPAKAVFDACLSDKKRRGNRITLAVPFKTGQGHLIDIDIPELEKWIERGLK